MDIPPTLRLDAVELEEYVLLCLGAALMSAKNGDMFCDRAGCLV